MSPFVIVVAYNNLTAVLNIAAGWLIAQWAFPSDVEADVAVRCT